MTASDNGPGLAFPYDSAAMKILLTNPRGFCAGVAMAIDVVDQVVNLFPGKTIYVYHQIVHNKHVVGRFEDRGVVFVDDLDEVPSGQIVVFSAHGVSPEVRRHADARGLTAIDATCPLVTKDAEQMIDGLNGLSYQNFMLHYNFLPLGFVLLRPDPDGAFQLTPAAFAPALTLLAGALAGSLIWITVSAEDAPDLIASAPVHVRAVDRAKLFAAIAPVLALMVLPLLALSARDAWAGAWAAGGVIANAFAGALIGVWRRTPGSRKDFVRRRQNGSLITSLGKAFIGLGITATVGAGAYGFPWLALIPAIITFAMLGALYKPTPRFAEA